jgi:Rieske Fe-S protein
MEDINQISKTQLPEGRRDFLKNVLKITGIFTLFSSLSVIILSKKRSQRFALALDSFPTDQEYLIGKVGDKNFVLFKDNTTFSAYNLQCTHAGCTTQWQPKTEQFYCACHNGIFDKNGKPISGPPNKPLEKLMLYTENSHIIIIE